jgi:SAM-dependent methyltransferase
MTAIKESAGISLEIQRRLSEVDRYNDWIFRQFEPHVGRRVLDVGCAIGNITQFFLDRELVVGIDAVREFVEFIRARFADHPNFRAELHDIASPSVLSLEPERFDTITCANVLEHVSDDRQALAHMFSLLVPGGRVLLLVPAFRALWGTLDDIDDHYRRYNRPELRSKLNKAGFDVEQLYFMNPLGIAGWLLNGKLLKRDVVPAGQYSLYNRLVPVLAGVERIVKPPFGLSLIAIARKPDA